MAFFEPGALRVKICGITRESDAQAAIEAGADALGFNFWTGSKRFLDPAVGLSWILKLSGAARIAVVVNPDVELLARLHQAACFDAIQFHGDESPAFCREQGGVHWIKAFALRSESEEIPSAFPTDDFLLDAPTAQYGGSGVVADWSRAAEVVKRYPAKRFFLAGGLNPENVAAAVRAVRPHGVDVASGVESSPGVKDLAKVREFVRVAKAAGK